MILFKKAMRSMWRGKKSYIACVVLLGIGISLFVAFNQMTDNLATATNSLYSSQRFAHGFASVSAIPLTAVERLADIEGISNMQTTIVADARVEKVDSYKIITLRLNSFDAAENERLNNFAIKQGDVPGDDGILLGDAFAFANGYMVGDEITLVLNGTRVCLQVSGLVQSPEYIFAVPEAGRQMPDNELFGYAFVTQSKLATLTGLDGMATNLAFTFENNHAFKDIQPALEEALEQYGLNYLIDRENHPSNAMLQQEIKGLGGMATAIPMVFIIMAVIILYIMLKRIIEQERGQIGTLKALGFSDASIILHYIGYGSITGLVGGLLGLLLAFPISTYVTATYTGVFSLPHVDAPMRAEYIAGGIILAVVAGVMGAVFGARSTLKLSPSEAMRAEAPHGGVKKDAVSRIPFAQRLFSQHGIMAIRNIFRNKFRSAFVVLGVAFSFALIAYMVSYGEMFDTMMLKQFTKVELYNIKISLQTPAGHSQAIESTNSLPGIRTAETLLELPVEASMAHRKRSFSLTGMQDDSMLYRVYDSEQDIYIPLRPGGVVLSSNIAQDLNVSPGDVLTITTGYTGDRQFGLPVVSVINANLGAGAYIQQQTLWNLLGMQPTINSLILNADDPDAVKDSLRNAENVAAITDQAESRAIYEKRLSSYSSLIAMLQLAGIGVAYAIITNTATISLSERKREYATMRVLGMHPGEISRVVGFEYWVLALLAVQPGILLTQFIKRMLASSMSNDNFSVPVSTDPSSFFWAAILCFAAVFLSNWRARQKIAHFDMVEVLKERE